MLTGKGVEHTMPVGGVIRTVEGMIRAGQDLTNFGMEKYYQNEPKFNGVYSRNNLPRIKDVAYLSQCKLIEIN